MAVLVVTPSFPAKSFSEFIAYAKSNKGKISLGSGGIGSISHLCWALFSMLAGVEMLQVSLVREQVVIPKDFWDEWCRQNSDSDALANKVLIAFPKQADTEACAKEHEKLTTGREPLDPDGDPRTKREGRGSGLQITTAAGVT